MTTPSYAESISSGTKPALLTGSAREFKPGNEDMLSSRVDPKPAASGSVAASNDGRELNSNGRVNLCLERIGAIGISVQSVSRVIKPLTDVDRGFSSKGVQLKNMKYVTVSNWMKCSIQGGPKRAPKYISSYEIYTKLNSVL
jgi:hypothetical protein